MKKLFGNVRGWWASRQGSRSLAAPYAVACECGDVLRGFRRAHFLAPRCKVCGQRVFILPASPLPAPVEPTGELSAPPSVAPTRPRPSRAMSFRLSLVLAVASVVVCVGLAGLLILWSLGPGVESTSAKGLGDELKARMAEGSHALAEGNFQLAAEELQSAQDSLHKHPDSLSPGERRQLQRMQQQAALLADLLSDSLGEILGRAAGQEDREWQAVFNRRYKDKAVIFEAEVRRDAAGKCHLDYLLHVEREPVRIDLDGLKLLERLPIDKPQRLLFGARVASIRRESPGPSWVIRFLPDSGVLITHAGAAAACGLPTGEDELDEILERQSMWERNLDAS